MYNTVLRSEQDRSINLLTFEPDGGKIEARFVQREEDTIIVYLSSMTGCNLSCRFCYLTQMNETTSSGVTVRQYLDQAHDVLELVDNEDKLIGVKTVHFNFMARGDALYNPHFVYKTKDIIDGLAGIAKSFHLSPKFKISTIFPTASLAYFNSDDLGDWIKQTLALEEDVEFYYSLYSLDPAFRRRWIPKAMDPEMVGELFRGSEQGFRIHHALIGGENSSIRDTALIKDWLNRHDITCRLNIVRYNPFGPNSGKEASDGDINTYREFMKMSSNIIDVHVVSRVGMDVAASCGMFI